MFLKGLFFMGKGRLCKEVEADIGPIIENMGFKLVELKLSFSHRKVYMRIVIYKNAGVSIGDCTNVSKVIMPRLELMDEFNNLTLEVTSPGIDRVLKSSKEYEIFKGRGIKIKNQDSGDWIGGIIDSFKDNRLLLASNGQVHEFDIDKIVKAKLDHSQEG
jgi:ribosome maturation factor RimP